MSIKRFNSGLAVVVMLTLTLVAFFGVTYGMGMRSDGTMKSCMFSNIEVICSMSVFEHINLWNLTFAAHLPNVAALASLSLVILLLGLAFAVIVAKRHLHKIFRNAAYQKLYLKQKSYLNYFDYLKEAFSQGIINPKIYDSTSL